MMAELALMALLASLVHGRDGKVRLHLRDSHPAC